MQTQSFVCELSSNLISDNLVLQNPLALLVLSFLLTLSGTSWKGSFSLYLSALCLSSLPKHPGISVRHLINGFVEMYKIWGGILKKDICDSTFFSPLPFSPLLKRFNPLDHEGNAFIFNIESQNLPMLVVKWKKKFGFCQKCVHLREELCPKADALRCSVT